jgi:hypothetical protein
VTQNALRRAPRRQQQVFTALSSTWNPFPEPRYVDVLLVGGGGGGGSVAGGTTGIYPGPGGAGGQVVVIKDYFFVGPVSIAIGTGGAADNPGQDTMVTPNTTGNPTGVGGGVLLAKGGLQGFPATTAAPSKYNSIKGSSAGGTAHVRNAQDGATFGMGYVLRNYYQVDFYTNGFPPTSGYPYGAGGGGGSMGSVANTYHAGVGKYGAGVGGNSAANGGVARGGDAAPNSGGGGGGAGNTTGSAVLVPGGTGGSGIVIFAWND